MRANLLPVLVRAATLLVCTWGLSACQRVAEESHPEPADYQRIAVLGPSTAANLWLAGQGDRVIAVSDYCTVPGAASLPRIGGQLDPATERLTQLAPDLVLVQGKIRSIEQWCALTETPLHAFTTDTLEPGWYAEMETLGRILQEEQAFENAAESFRARIVAVRAGAAEQGTIPSALLVVSRRPGEVGGVMAAGPKSFLSELLVVAGGRNVLTEGRDYFDLNEESLLRLQPDVILEFHPGGIAEGNAPAAIWAQAMPALTAAKQGRVRAITHSDALMPGPGMADAAAEIAAALR